MKDGDQIPTLARSAAVIPAAFAVTSAIVLAAGKDYPDLHTILDAGSCLLAGLLALLFWDMGTRLDLALKKWLAVSFAVTAVAGFVHALVNVEWSGPLAFVAQMEGTLRPATWPVSAYILPVGILCSVLLTRRFSRHMLGFIIAMVALEAALLGLFLWLPRYSEPAAIGITRPTLVLAPVLWALVAVICWRLRARDRILPTLTLMAVLSFVAHSAMLYSHAPHDAPAMVAHLGKIAGYLVVLLTLMRFASWDMLQRTRAERELAQLNQVLEGRVAARTAELESANATLGVEVSVRRQAEEKARAQLERLNLLHQITRAIGERQDLHSIFQVVVRSVEDDLSVDFACICLREPGLSGLAIASVGIRSEPLALELALTKRERIAIDENGLSRCMRGDLVYEPDVSAIPMPFPQRLAKGGLRSVVLAPLLVESEVFGVLVAARREVNSFVSGECEFLRQLSEHVALASHQAQLHGALQRAYDDLRQTQQAAVQHERLRALGQMASGIAHDINNAISPVALYTESLLEQEPNLSDRARGHLEIIQRAIDDVAQTVARMREFYRQSEPQLALNRVDLNAVVGQVVDLTRARWRDMPQQVGSVIQVVTDLAPEMPAVMGVEGEIREALINLIFNAVDAMPTGGTLTVRTRSRLGDPEANGAPGARHALIEVIDTGIGMDEDTRRRCLEPFFTTKGERGTGLGLAMVYGALQRHGAEIEIDSALGTGTTARCVFQAVQDSAEAVKSVSKHVVPSRRLRILIVDDDPLVLKSLRDTLERDGHLVSAENGGRAGIDAFHAASLRKESFDVVITDLGMPHVDGRVVAATVKQASPTTPVIMLTGWGQRLAANGDKPASVDRVLGKPSKLRELREALFYCTTADAT